MVVDELEHHGGSVANKAVAFFRMSRSARSRLFSARRAADGAAPKTRYIEAVLVRQLVNDALACDLLGDDPLKG